VENNKQRGEIMKNEATDEDKEKRLYRYRVSWFNTAGFIVLCLFALSCVGYFSRFYLGTSLPALIVIPFFVWGLLDDLRALPYSTMGIAISRERVALQRKDGKEKKTITQVTKVKTWVGLARRVEIMGLSPEGKKARIRVARRELKKEQMEDLKLHLQQLFPKGN